MLGITPTYVGNTVREPEALSFLEDHPHLRGEHAENTSALTDAWGSPPLTWGTPGGHVPYAIMQRITPTYVGNTQLVQGQSMPT